MSYIALKLFSYHPISAANYSLKVFCLDLHFLSRSSSIIKPVSTILTFQWFRQSSDSGLKKERGPSLTFSVNTDTEGAAEGSNLCLTDCDI